MKYLSAVQSTLFLHSKKKRRLLNVPYIKLIDDSLVLNI